VVGNASCTAGIVPISAVSRKTHGPAGIFDIPLPLTGTPGIECRSGGATHDYQMVVTFAAPVTVSSATASGGTVVNTSASGNTVTVNLTNVPNAQTINVTLVNVNSGTQTGNVVIPMSLLLGDTTASGAVNSSDVGEAKANSGQTTNAANFRTDVNVNGAINSTDVSLIKSQSGTSLPPAPPEGPGAAAKDAVSKP
jgi:hypothetical protein